VPIEEAPQRPDADRYASFRQQRLDLDQGDIVRRLDAPEDEGGMRLDPGRAAVTALRLRCRRAVTKRQLPPADRAGGAHTEASCGLTARHPAFDCGHHPIT
jgi:hypothetical protein